MVDSTQLDNIPKTYDAAVMDLAAAHAVGDDLIDIYCVPDPEGQVVRLIEVSNAFPEGGVERPVQAVGVERVVPVFSMGPAKDFPFRSEIVQITPAEWHEILNGELMLNRDWGDLQRARKVRHGQ